VAERLLRFPPASLIDVEGVSGLLRSIDDQLVEVVSVGRGRLWREGNKRSWKRLKAAVHPRKGVDKSDSDLFTVASTCIELFGGEDEAIREDNST